MFPVKRRQRLDTERNTPLKPLLFRSTISAPLLFRFNAIKAAIYPVARHYCRDFFG